MTGWLGARCVAFAAATPRGVRTGDWAGTVMLKSFMTVAADLKGQGIGRELRRRIVGVIASHAHPILRFGERSAAFEGALTQDYSKGGMHVRFLGPCIAAAAMAKGGAPGAHLGAEEFMALWSARSSDAVVNPLPQTIELAHYLRDPRQRVLLGVRNRDGALAAGAMAVRTAVVSKRGVDVSVQLEQLAVGRNVVSDSIARLAADAAHWGYAGGAGVVTIPNIGDSPWPLLAAAGLRKLSARYSVWAAAARESHPLLGANATNLEVV